MPVASDWYIEFNALSSCIQFTDLSNDETLAISAFAAAGDNFINACALLIEFVAAFLYVESDVNDEPVELTFKEFELLKLLMLNVGIVMTREVIMIRVWGTEFEGESRTVDMHIKTLRQKLKESGSQIKTVRNVGYVLE